MKKILAIIGTAICVLFMGGCVDVCAGLCIGVPVILCTTCYSSCEKPYLFIHDEKDVADAKSELVTVKWNSDTEKKSIETVLEITDKDAFLAEFNEVGFTYPYEPYYGIHVGKAVCFTFPDGQVEVVTFLGCGLFTDRSLEEDIDYSGRAGGDGLLELWDRWAQQ